MARKPRYYNGMSSEEYWNKRAEDLDRASKKAEDKVLKEISSLYKKAFKEAKDELYSFYDKYAKDNNITMAQAMKELTPADARANQKKLQELKKLYETTSNENYLREYKKLSSRVKITRFHSLLDSINTELIKVAGEAQVVLEDYILGLYTKEHKEFLETLKKKDIRVYKTTNKIFEDLTDTENTQGIIGVVKFKQRTLEENLTDDNRFVLILDRIQDPGNMGTIIRTADAAGVDAIIALKGCVDIYNPKVIRSTMGSIFDMNVIHATQEEALRVLKLKKFDIVSSYLDTNNYYNTVEYNYKTALVIGNEANGINEELVSKSDVLVKIPIYGKAESLNAAISSAILMYEIKKYLV